MGVGLGHGWFNGLAEIFERQARKNEELEKKIKNLEKRINELEKQLSDILAKYPL